MSPAGPAPPRLLAPIVISPPSDETRRMFASEEEKESSSSQLTINVTSLPIYGSEADRSYNIEQFHINSGLGMDVGRYSEITPKLGPRVLTPDPVAPLATPQGDSKDKGRKRLSEPATGICLSIYVIDSVVSKRE